MTLTRAYSSTQGRFINRDMIGEKGGTNLYAYMDNHPEIGVDPSGRCIAAVAAVGIGEAIAGAGISASAGVLAINTGQAMGNALGGAFTAAASAVGSLYDCCMGRCLKATSFQEYADCVNDCASKFLGGPHYPNPPNPPNPPRPPKLWTVP